MTIDIIAIAISIIDIVATVRLALKTYDMSKQQNELAKQENNLTKQQNELTEQQIKLEQANRQSEIQLSITSAEDRIVQYGLLINEDSDEDSMNPKLIQANKVAWEQYRNVYEEACSQYLNSKVDREWFKEMYFDVIKELVEGESNKDYYADRNNSIYQNTRKVYEEWYNFELN